MNLSRLRYWWNRTARERQLREEMEAHLDEAAAELRERGWPAAAARDEARSRFGNIGAKQEESREVWIARYASDLAQDLRYACRSLRSQPSFALVAILSTGLGIAACSTVFSIINFALFQPLPVAEPERLMTVSGFHQEQGVGGETISYPEARDLNSLGQSWTGAAAFAPLLPAGIRPPQGEARRHWGFLVTSNYFDVVKPRFTLGGGFTRDNDDQPGAPAKIVLTHHLWVNRFGADPALIGQVILVNKQPMTVTGVTGPGFRGTEVMLGADFFLPFSQIAELNRLGKNDDRLTSYGSQWLYSLVRLKPDVDLPKARAELDTIAAAMRARESAMARRGFYLERAGQLMAGIRRLALPAFLLLLAVALLVLLTACANVANLLLARAAARGREIATRLAIGAGRGRLIRQMLAESTLLACLGGLLGVGLTQLVALRIGSFELPLPIPIDLTPVVDWRVLGFALILSLGTGIAFGLLPALRATRSTLQAGLNSAARARLFGPRNALVVAQVAISAMLVICAGLFLRSLGAASAIDSGMNPDAVVLVRFDPSLSRYDAPSLQKLLVEVQRKAQSLPGVSAASVVNFMPLSLGGNFTMVKAPNRNNQHTAVAAVGPRYFEAMGISMRSGQDFPANAPSEPVVIVNEELARLLYPGQIAIGQFVHGKDRPARIIGVVANTKYRMLQEIETTPILYKPLLGDPSSEPTMGGLTLIVRSTQSPVPLGQALRGLLLDQDRELVVNVVGTLAAHFEGSLIVPRLAAWLFGLCGVVGLLIAAIGIYGVISFTVARRSREIGIRLAVGARSAQVVQMVLWHGLTVALIGLMLGMGGGFLLAQGASSLLAGISPYDKVTFVAVPLVLLAVAILAAALPARRAARLDPSCTLRAD
jgi:predicted permease